MHKIKKHDIVTKNAQEGVSMNKTIKKIEEYKEKWLTNELQVAVYVAFF